VSWLENSRPESVVSYLRRSGTDSILVVVNASNRRVEGTVQPPVSGFREVLKGPSDSVAGEQFQLGAFGYWVGKANPQ
jgi:hypothetical protein